MTGKAESIDARGLVCPEPVIRVKRAIDSGHPDRIEVLVDNPAARENVTRFALHSGFLAEAAAEGEGTWRIVMTRQGGSAATRAAEAAAAPALPAGSAPVLPVPAASGALSGMGGAPSEVETLLVASDRIGQGDDSLGAVLSKGFFYALAEGDKRPARIILMNSGVRLAVGGSASLKDLSRLAEQGVEVLACGTCLDFFGLKDSLAVGRVTNMYEIAGFLMQGRALHL